MNYLIITWMSAGNMLLVVCHYQSRVGHAMKNGVILDVIFIDKMQVLPDPHTYTHRCIYCVNISS